MFRATRDQRAAKLESEVRASWYLRVPFAEIPTNRECCGVLVLRKCHFVAAAVVLDSTIGRVCPFH